MLLTNLFETSLYTKKPEIARKLMNGDRQVGAVDFNLTCRFCMALR